MTTFNVEYKNRGTIKLKFKNSNIPKQFEIKKTGLKEQNIQSLGS